MGILPIYKLKCERIMDNMIEGRFWISKSEHSFLGKGRIELLLLIEQTGSIF